jgi:hypothetical protein
MLVPALFTGVMLAQGDAKTDKQGKNEHTTITGCLTKASDGNYTITDEKTGKQITVTGPSELDKHAANHKVQLTGTENTSGGTTTFIATSVKHISETCTPAPPK